MHPPSSAQISLFNTLLRTHHITSRKKVARIKKAAHRLSVSHVLLRSGGSPGIMYAEGSEEGVSAWVTAVQNLRYKDFRVLCRPAPLHSATSSTQSTDPSGSPIDATQMFEEVETVASFASEMDKRGLLDWWRRAMGYAD